MPSQTPKTTTEDIFAALDLGVFEQIPEDLFRPAGALPEWLKVETDSRGLVDLADSFPLLEVFFMECEDAWDKVSDIWTEPDGHGGELYLQAVAASIHERRMVAIRALPQALFTYQQLAHDFELEKEKVERLSRELEIKRQEAERATQAKSTFLATMSHEIRTPLNAIIGMADVLSASELTREQTKCVDVFQRNGVGLLNLINDILDLSKVEAGHVELEQTAFSLPDVIARAAEVVEIRVNAKGLALRQNVAPDVPAHLIGDPNRLRQVIINLLGNSIKFTEKGGLEVRVERDPEDASEGRLRFAIVDTGIGIPREKLGSIFESFTQADSSTTRQYGGTGLGLTISRQLVELMGGRIWVESTVGVGSTFFFTAQFGIAAAQPAHTEDALRKVQASRQDLEEQLAGMRILLADDSEDNRFLITSYLKRTRSHIDIAENGEVAARKFKAGHYDVVLMDVEMPVLDGYGATREIRTFETATGAAPTPVFALTAHAFAEMAVKGIEAGFTAILTKPIKHLTLLEALMPYRREGASAEAAPITVEMEEGMEDVIPGYLAKRRAEVALYRDALAAGDFEAIRQLAHKMRGTGAGYGFPPLTEFGGAMEHAAVACNTAAVADALSKFAEYVERVELVPARIE